MDDCLERTQSMVAMTKLETSEEEDGQQVHEPNDSTTVLAAGQETKQEENNGGGGFIDQLVNNLPSVSAPLSIPGTLIFFNS